MKMPIIMEALLTDFELASDLVLLKKTNSDTSFLFFDLLAMLRFDSEFHPSKARNSMSRSLVTDPNLRLKGPENNLPSIDRGDSLPIRQLSDEYQKQSLQICRFCRECHYHRDYSSEEVADRTATKMATKKTSAENLLRAVQRSRTQTTKDS
ncbi:hypothetical protein ACTXT7_016687 [Hymenolepis weldensis]